MTHEHTRCRRGTDARLPQAGILAAITLLTCLTVAPPEATADGGPGRPLRLEGYFGADTSAADVLDLVTISPDGRDRRAFGVTALQAYKPEEEGAQVLRATALRPITFMLRGAPELVERFFAADPHDQVVAYGVYGGGAGIFALISVEVHPVHDRPGAL